MLLNTVNLLCNDNFVDQINGSIRVLDAYKDAKTIRLQYLIYSAKFDKINKIAILINSGK